MNDRLYLSMTGRMAGRLTCADLQMSAAGTGRRRCTCQTCLACLGATGLETGGLPQEEGGLLESAQQSVDYNSSFFNVLIP